MDCRVFPIHVAADKGNATIVGILIAPRLMFIFFG